MFCSPARIIRNANGHSRHTVVMTIAQNAFVPISQNGGSSPIRCRSPSSLLSAPLSRSSRKLHAITET